MSHFSVVAILPEDIFQTDTPDLHEAVEAHLERVMEPYNENVEVEPYEEECHCVSHQVRVWVQERMDAQFDSHWEDTLTGQRIEYDDIPKTEEFMGRKEIDRKRYVHKGGLDSFRESFGPIKEAITAKYPGVPDEFDFDFEWPERNTPEHDELLERYHAKQDEVNEAWQNHLAPYRDAEANYEIEAEKLGIRKADPTCGFYTEDFLRESYSDGRYGVDNGDGTWTLTEGGGQTAGTIVRPGDRFEDGSGCGGTGKQMSTYNPNSKWDWYVIGGRWDGDLRHLPPLDDGQGGFNFGDQFHTLGRNITTMDDATNDPPYAFVTPEGEWVGKGEMGWWGMSSGDEDRKTWQQTWDKARESYASHYAVQLDCHI